MPKPSPKSMFESLKGHVAPPEPSPAPTEAAEDFLLGEGVERPVVEASPGLHEDLWMLGAPTYQRRIAFTESIGSRFGDVGLTSRFILDRWSEQPAGMRWTLDPGPIEAVTLSARARDLLDGTFTRTQVGLGKLAMAQYGGDVDCAIVHAIDEEMAFLGLDRYIPDEPQEEW